MPRNYKFKKEEIINSCLDIVRKSGFSSLTARSIGEKIGASSKPVFSLFNSMSELKNEVLTATDRIYKAYLNREIKENKYPAYKASGMGYIRFAREEKELFKLLFMRDRSNESIGENRDEIRPILNVIQSNLNISEDEAYFFHLKMWICVHGIATMIATSFLEWDEELVSQMLTDYYSGLKNSLTTQNRGD